MKPTRSNRFLCIARSLAAAPAIVISFFGLAHGAPVTWNVTNGNWDTVTSNWLPGPGLYANGDDATFDQAAGGTVTQVGTIAPGSTTVSAASGTYTFQGTGISSGALNKSGAGTLVLGNGNTYTGATTISGGTLKVSDPVVTLPAISGLVVQLDATQIAAADGSSVTTWTNLAAGGAGNFTATTGAGAVNPTYVASGATMNGRPVVRFNNSAMLTNATVTGNNRTIIYVGRLNGGSNRRLVGGINNNWLMGYWGAEQDVAHLKQSNGFIYRPQTAVDYASHLYSVTVEAAGNASFFINGTKVAGPTAGYEGPNGLALGGYSTGLGAEQSIGEIGELLVFNRVLSDSERVEVENYLQAKWNGALPAKTAVNLTASGATFDTNGAKPTIGSLAGVAGSQVLVNGGTLTIGNDNTATTFSGVVANGTTAGGAILKTGLGDLTLAGDSTNTFTGTTNLISGRIGLSKTGGAYAVTGDFLGVNNASPDVFTTVDNQFAPGSVMRFSGTVGDHVRFELLGTTQTLAGLDNTAAPGRGVIQHREQVTAAAVGAVSNLILNGSGSYTYDGYLRGNGGALGLTKNGSGTQILSGGKISYNGGTNLNSGILQFEGGNKGISGGMVLNGGILNHNGTGYLTVGGVLNVAVNSAVNVTNSGASGNQLHFDGGVTGAGNLVITNTGSATTGVNFRNSAGNHTGNLTVNGGQIGISNGAGLVLANSNLTLTAAAVNLTAITNNTATNASIKSLAGDSASSVVLGAQTLTLGSNNGSGSFAGSITGTTGGLIKSGNGTQTLAGPVTYGGNTTVTGGTLNLDYNTSNVEKLSVSGILTMAGGTLNLTGGTITELPSSVTLNAGASRVSRSAGNSFLDMGNITRNPGATINFSEDNIASTYNTLTNGILGTWATVGSGANTRFATIDGGGVILGLIGTTATTVNDFVDDFENYDYSLSGGTDTQTGNRIANTVRYSGSGETIDLSTFDLTIKTLMNVGTGSLTVTRSGGTGSLVANDLFLNGVNAGFVVSAPITGSDLSTSGDVTLSGANSYTGTTTINDGTVLAGSASALGTTAVTIYNGVLNINGQSLVFNSLAGDALSSITNGGAAAVLTLGNSTSTTYAGSITDGAGALSLTKVGTGTQILSGTSTYSGTTTISAGTLQIGDGGSSGTLGSADVANNGILQFAWGNSHTVPNAIIGTGAIYVRPGNDLTLTGPVTCGTLRFDVAGNRTVTLSGTAPNVINAFQTTGDSNGTLIFAKPAGVNAFSGSVLDVGNGYNSTCYVRLQNDEQIPDTTEVRMYGTQPYYSGHTYLDLNGHNETIAGVTSTNSWTYVRNGAATPSALTLSGSGTYGFAGYVQDAGSAPLNIVKSGSGTQTFSGNGIDYNGTTTVDAGRLILNNNDDSWTSGMSITSGATVEIYRDSGTTYEHQHAFTLSGAGTLEKTGNGIVYMNWSPGGTFSMASGGLIHVKAGELRLGYGVVSNWADNKADLLLDAGTVFDLWDNNDTTAGLVVDSLNGNGNIARSNYGQTGNLTIGVDDGGGIFSGIISNASGSTRVIKAGAGTQTFTGVNSYTGGTEVTGGVLIGTNASSIGTNGGLKLNGGSFAYQPSIAGALALGTGVLNLADGSVLGVAIGGTNGQSAITSSAAAVTTGSVTLNIAGISGTPAVSGSHALISAASGLSAASYAIGTVVNPTSFTLGALAVTDTEVTVTVNGVSPLPAAYWKGGFSSGNNVWALSNGSSTSNWASDNTGTATPLVPGATSIANFSATGATNQGSMTLGANMGVAGIVVSDSSSIALNADGNILTLGASGMLINNGAGAVTLSNDLALGAAQAWTNNSALPVGLTIAGTVDTATFGLNVGGSGFTALSGSLIGTGGLSKSDSGTLALSGTTPYSGTLPINGGTLKVASTTALNGSSVITVADAAGAAFNIAGFNTTVGSIAGGGSTGGAIQLGASTLTTGGLNTSIAFSGTITGTGGSLFKTGTANLTLNGPVSNTYTGKTILSGTGQLVLSKTGGAIAIPGDIDMAATGTRAIISATQDNQFAPGAVMRFTTTGDTRFELKGTTQTLGGIDNTGLSGNHFIQHSEFGAPAAVDGTSMLILDVAGSNAFTFNTASGSLRDYNGGVLSLEKKGTGTQTLLGTNVSFSGSLTINGGKLSAVRFGSASNARTITVNATGTMEFLSGNTFGGHNTTSSPTLVINNGGTVTNAVPSTNNALRNVTLNGGTLTSTVTSSSILDRDYETYGTWGLNGTVTSTGASTITTAVASDGYVLLNSSGTSTTFDVTSDTLTVSAVLIDGDRGTTPAQYATDLVKTGAGTLALSKANTYTGNTAVNGGTLLLTGSVAGTASVGTTGTLAGNGTVTGAATIATTGIVSPGNASVATLNFGAALTLETGSSYQSTITGASTNDKVNVAGTMAANGTIKVTLSGYVPAQGNSFDLADAASITGSPSFDFSEAVLPDGLTWDTSSFTTNGTITVAEGSTYQDWINGFTFAPGADKTPTGDPDNDGIPNGAEMVLGGNPATGMDSALLPTIEMVTNPVSVPAIPAGTYLLFTYRRTDLSVAAGVLATCQTDADLVAPWTTVTGTAPEVIQVDDNYSWTNPSATNTDRVRVYVPSNANSKLFGRLDVKVP